ncbi:uncharacterized protein HD556DRAFT_1305891 [Suillus plorans]|uniref:Uncharacterized protein n=1 Tax=Suillus plorans TaxID=116603 RepID=A0A9P7DME2_9AGAM|nr:uncharacterized protein HD556DRAFT_1305891 [Suillus plorans]KAG1798417.1 hypothetical protein HD556DRAFT_1305891 [Suillus plorans]
MCNSKNNNNTCHPLTAEPPKFTINELAAALQLIRDQEEIFKVLEGTSTGDLPSLDLMLDDSERPSCVTCGAKTPAEEDTKPAKPIISAVSDVLIALLVNDGMSPSTAIVLE